MRATGAAIAVANYKGGVGKSTIAAHLAASHKAVLVDLDVNGDGSPAGTDPGPQVAGLTTT